MTDAAVPDDAPATEAHASSTDADPWWRAAVVYQIYPRSFCDTTGDGVGDLEGVRRHLDHLVDLGVDALWLSPFFRSPMADYGYDVSDFCDVDPVFGDLAAFDRLVGEAHERGLRVVIDWVPNHTSIEHPWFAASRSSRTDPKRDWYIWRDGGPDGSPPNNWTEALTFGRAWTFDEATGQWYLHNFLPSQPDLNWANHEVVEAMLATLRFWLDRGVDGFRMDVVNLIGKDPALADDPPELAGLPHLVVNDRPETHALLRRIRALLDGYPGDRMAIGEVILLDIEGILGHLGDGDELHLAFNFPPLHGPWTAEAWRQAIATTEAAYGAADAWPTWVLSNHDVVRHRTRYGGDERVARSAAVLLTMLRGTPFLYAGEELGLSDAVVAPHQVHDPAGRDGCRAPIPWDDSPDHGWAGGRPWLPWPPEAEGGDASTQAADPDSTLWLYRRLLALRRSEADLRHGALELLDAPPGVVHWRRGGEGGRWSVAVNFTDALVADARPPGRVVVTSRRADEPEPPPGALGPHEAVVVHRG